MPCIHIYGRTSIKVRFGIDRVKYLESLERFSGRLAQFECNIIEAMCPRSAFNQRKVNIVRLEHEARIYTLGFH